jgi:diguanylate cyclase (GGDEF)-like protein
VLGLIGVLSWIAAATLWTDRRGGVAPLQRAVGGAGALFGTYYLLRLVFFVLVGPDDALFRAAFGTVPTTLAITVLLIAITFTVAALHTEQQTLDLQVRASRDGLTGLLNRQEFLRLAEVEARLLGRARRPAAVVMADIDHFKQVNDRFGHDAGDAVLRAFAASSRQALRSTDLLGRYGGEEFVFLLPGASTAEAEHVMEDVRQQVARTEEGPRVTASFGVAGLQPGGSVAEALSAADAALYRAKAQGRDRVVQADG